ncbi:MAG: hypothetical protein EOP24_35940 [Hyphomicrobiales bacterium]|nr:MAG: hypothetical protein EOP24_35940 [Hyphomicrobiales bacterium]
MTERRFDAVFCDDLRQEINGKHILIGVYGGSLIPSTLPAQLAICVWLRVTPPIAGPHRFKLGLRTDAGEAGVQGDLDFAPTSDSHPIAIATGQIPITVTKPGMIEAIFSLDEGPEQVVGTLAVEGARVIPTNV